MVSKMNIFYWQYTFTTEYFNFIYLGMILENILLLVGLSKYYNVNELLTDDSWDFIISFLVISLCINIIILIVCLIYLIKAFTNTDNLSTFKKSNGVLQGLFEEPSLYSPEVYTEKKEIKNIDNFYDKQYLSFCTLFQVIIISLLITFLVYISLIKRNIDTYNVLMQYKYICYCTGITILCLSSLMLFFLLFTLVNYVYKSKKSLERHIEGI